MSLSGNSGRPVKLKVPAEYKFHNFVACNKPLDEVINLSASVTDQVSLPRTVPELTPVDPSVASTSTRTESSICNVSRDVVVDNVAVSQDVRHDLIGFVGTRTQVRTELFVSSVFFSVLISL